MNLRVMNDKIALRRVKDPEAVSKGGIILGEQAYDLGEVVGVGPGKIDSKGKRSDMWGIAPGMVLAFSPNGNQEHEVNGEKLVFIARDSVIGVMEGTKS